MAFTSFTTGLSGKTSVILLSFLAGIGLLYQEVLPKWVLVLWHDPNYSHGLLIPLVVWYAVGKQLDRSVPSLSTTTGSQSFGLLLLGVGFALYFVGRVSGEFFAQRLSFALVLYAILPLLFGPVLARRLLFPVSLVLLAIPIPYILYNAMAFPLKLVATKISVQLIALSGLAVFRDGNIIHLPHTVLEVVDACSGIRSLATLFALAYCLAGFFQRSWVRRVLLLLMVVPIAILSNSLRLFATAWLTRLGSSWSIGWRHELTGWLVFVVAGVLLFSISFLFQRSEKRTNSVFSRHYPSPLASGGSALFPLVGLFFLATVFFFTRSVQEHPSLALQKELTELPSAIGAYVQQEDRAISPEIAAVLRADATLLRRYRNADGYDIWVFIGYFGRQQEGTIIHSPRHCLPGSGWETGPSEQVRIPTDITEKKSVTVNRLVIQKGQEQQLVHYWFQGRGRVLASEFLDRGLMVVDAVTQQRSDGALVRITGPMGDGALPEQRAFIRQFLPLLAKHLP